MCDFFLVNIFFLVMILNNNVYEKYVCELCQEMIVMIVYSFKFNEYLIESF